MDEYFSSGINQLAKNASLIPEISEQLHNALDDAEGQKAINALTEQWQGWDKLQKAYQKYVTLSDSERSRSIEVRNKSQQKLPAQFNHSSPLCTKA